ncbi:hypothetical protein BZA77DRAFT_361778 [Pyronema omphalodes]|nr:hypothetical protein BZA77DRAFT_361778 [Pyronema omphalodes]
MEPPDHAKQPLLPPNRLPNKYGTNNDDDIAPPIKIRPSIRQRLSSYSGVLWMLLAEFIGSLNALIARVLETSLPEGRRLHPLTLICWRMTLAFAGCLAWGYYKKVPHFPLGERKLQPLLQVRGIGGFIGVLGFYYALTGLPLPDATVISFLTPTLVGIGCAVLPLKEPFTRIEMAGAVVSFGGVLLIAQPPFLFGGGDNPGPTDSKRMIAVAIALVGVCGSATAMTCLRWIGKRTPALIPVTYFSGVGAIASITCLLAIPSLPGIELPQSPVEWTLAAVLGGGGWVMQWALTKGLQQEKGGRGCQIIYTQLIFALFWELVVWGDLPSGMSVIGMAIILVSVVTVQVCKKDEVVQKEVKKVRPVRENEDEV